MAFNLASGGGGRGSRGLPAMAEINVTPFVDVALVLLIIFMITAHVMEYGIEVDVPKTKNVASSVEELPVVGISKGSEIYLGTSPVKLVQLADAIHTRYPGQSVVYVSADSKSVFDTFAQVASVLGAAKIGVRVVTQPDDSIGTKAR